MFVVTKHLFCCKKSMLVLTKRFLTNIFVMTTVLLRQAYFCCDKQVFVVTKHIFCCDKSMLVTTKLFCRLSQQAYFCCDKRHVLSWQTCVCHDKHVFVVTNLFVATKTCVSSCQCVCMWRWLLFVSAEQQWRPGCMCVWQRWLMFLICICVAGEPGSAEQQWGSQRAADEPLCGGGQVTAAGRRLQIPGWGAGSPHQRRGIVLQQCSSPLLGLCHNALTPVTTPWLHVHSQQCSSPLLGLCHNASTPWLHVHTLNFLLRAA